MKLFINLETSYGINGEEKLRVISWTTILRLNSMGMFSVPGIKENQNEK